VNEVMNLQFVQNVEKLTIGFITAGLSSSALLHRVSQLVCLLVSKLVSYLLS
jgi:hypothetical protein